MFNPTEADEQAYLQTIQKKLKDSLATIIAKAQDYAHQAQEQKKYLWENKTGMDHVEKISVRQSVDQVIYTGEAVVEKSKRVSKLIDSPYFGRFDFIEQGGDAENPIYVGVHAFFDEETQDSLIHDWRAPISTMFYDYETGPAQFTSPDGNVDGSITRKRQYRIRDGEMEFMIESDVNIHDDVLQKELSQAADDKMKNIVATIQRDQNAIIRNENSEVLIIQGVAGSGKTSIALHRIAFLLYRFKESMKSSDLLIISPNKVFADYISNVLPELGEESIPEIGIEELAKELLERKYVFENFFDQVSKLLVSSDKAYAHRIRSKSSLSFLHKLDDYIQYVNDNYFEPEDLFVGGRLVPEWFMRERFDEHKYMPIIKRLDKIVNDIEGNIGIYYHYDITPEERREIKIKVYKMFKLSTLRLMYKDFYTWMGSSELFKYATKSKYEYSDVFPLIYLKMHWDGIKKFPEVKHLLVDEMQDYTPVQYAVLSEIFPCKKTILGDANQSVNPFSSSSSVKIQEVFEGADVVKLCTSYRSTYEITEFAQTISPNDELKAIERHGDEPEVIKCRSVEEELNEVHIKIDEFIQSCYHSMGIICKTDAHAEEVYRYLKEKKCKVHWLNMDSQSYVQGVVVCTAYMSKGLEFDQVVVPHVTRMNYATDVDRSMLYVACTRAMHRLSLTYINTPSEFLAWH